MVCVRLRFASILIGAALLGAGGISLSAAETQAGRASNDSSVSAGLVSKAGPLRQDDVIALAGLRANAPAENGKGTSKLDTVEAVAIPEPTALFLAGFAGCMLLAVAQRLRGSSSEQR
jgi:hypothetical protein